MTLPNKRQRTSITDGRSGAVGANGGGGVSARLEKELERTLREFVRMKTVSSDPSLREDCFRGAKYLAHLLESLGTQLAIGYSLCQHTITSPSQILVVNELAVIKFSMQIPTAAVAGDNLISDSLCCAT